MACLRTAWIVTRARSAVRAGLVLALITVMAVVAPGRVTGATASTTLFVQSFGSNSIDPAYPVSVPALPSGASGANAACLTASGNTTSGVLRSCPNNNDSNGSGNLRLTTNDKTVEGGAFAAVSVPTSQGIDATFNTFQYGTPPLFNSPADGLAFVLAAVDPAHPVSPAAIGGPGGALGYSAYPGGSQAGLANAYLGIGLDVYGNFSNSSYQGTNCASPPYISSSGTVPGQVAVRGPGNGTAGYCAINSTATSTSSKAVSLRNNSRPKSVVPVEVVINPTAGSFTTASGIVVPAGQYAVSFTPAGGSTATTLTGTLPTVPPGLYPSASWTTAAGIPKQLAFGWVGSTGASVDFHEVDTANVVSFNPVPQLKASQTAYSVASPAPGAPVTYTVSAGVSSSGADEGSPVSLSQTLPAGVTPAGAYGTGWTCAPPSGQTITCTNSSTPITAGTTLPPITVEGIVTASGITAGSIQSGTNATASSADGNPGYASSAAAGTLPPVPSGVTLSPVSGPISGGTAVTVSGSNITNATAIEIGTTAQQQAGTPVVLLPCPSGPAPGCFTVNGATLSISSMPSVPASTTVNVTVVTLGVAGAPAYSYTDKPAAPTAPTATAGNASATVSWSAPASNNSPITGYVVTPYLAGVAQAPQSFDASTTTRTITGLTLGSSYTFTVAAVNAVGTGAAGPPSNAVVPYTLPGAPTIGTVSPANSAATVSWTAPASNGGSAITGYVVTPYIGGVAQAPQTFTSTATTQTVTGLTPGTSYTFKVAAVNAAGTGPASATSAAVTVNLGPSLSFSPPPAGEVSVTYSYPLTAAGGTGALTWSVSAGSLPPGLTVNPSNGLLSGTPTASGSYNFTVKVTDTLGATSSKPVTLVIAAVPSLANAAPSGQAGIAYSYPLTVTGGTGPFTWAISSGSLPPGLSLNASTGVVSGTPTTVGLYSGTVKVTDSFGLTASQSLSITITVGPLAITAKAGNSTVAQGGTLGYTITITNTAATAYSGVTFSVPLAGVLASASYKGDAAATTGTVSFASPNLTWTGNLAPGATATITFSVTVSSSYAGSGTLAITVTSATVGTNCYAGSTDPACTVSVPVSALTIVQTTTVPAATQGSVVGYTVTVTNAGGASYTGATFTESLSDILDNATYKGDAAATTGTVSYTSPNLTWTGNLAKGATATITFSVTVDNPDVGNKILTSTVTSATAGSNCPTGSTDARCTSTVTVQILAITSTADTSSATPGTTVHFTVTVANSGTANYAGVTITDALGGLLDDATYNGLAATNIGIVSYTRPNLTWTGDLAAGDIATITFAAVVNSPDAGDKVMSSTVTVTSAGSNCGSGSRDLACTASVQVLVPGLTVSNAVGASQTVPGAVEGYTLTIKNSGQTPYTGITVTDSLAGTLDDAAYNTGSEAVAGGGSVSYAGGVVTWTGDIAVNATVTVTFSVTVNNPDAGDKTLIATATSAAAGSTCPAGATASPCRVVAAVLTPALTVAATTDVASTVAAGTVHYTLTITDAGQIPYPAGTTVTDNLTGVLDDATYHGDAVASAGTLSYVSPSLTWTASATMNPGDSVTITFSATVNTPDAGNMILSTAATSGALGSNCPTGGADPRCATTVTVSQLTIVTGAYTPGPPTPISTTAPGGVVRYTTTFTNTGQTPYTGITVATNASDIFDDAAPNGDQTATSGTLVLSGTGLTWTGNIPVGATVTITGTVTVSNPDNGNKAMYAALTSTAPGSNCPTGGTDPRCSATVNVLIPALSITNAVGASQTVPGAVEGYTLTITNSGQTPYTGIAVTDSLAGTLDDAAYNTGSETASAGSVSYAGGVVTWTGDIAVNATVTVTFSVTVNNPDTGDKTLIIAAVSDAAGSTCPTGTTTTPCRITTAVLTPALAITATTDVPTTSAGSTVHYTLTITNAGQTPYTAITVSDNLTGALDDGNYNTGSETASSGTVTYTPGAPGNGVLAWTGTLNPGDTVTVTFSMAVKSPDRSGTLDMTTAATTPAGVLGSTCPVGGSDPRCATSVPIAQLTMTNTADVSTTTPGSVVHYSGTFTNTGKVPYTGIVINNIGDVFDNAVPNGDQVATSGTLVVFATGLTWTGNIPVGGTVTVTGSVTLNNATGIAHKTMVSTLVTATPGSNCGSGSVDPACTATVLVQIPALTVTNAASASQTVPGTVEGYTLTITNSGETPYTGTTVTDSLAGALDDAAYNNDAAATSGSVSYAGGVVTWTGDLVPAGTETSTTYSTVTVTFSVTVNNPDTGDKTLIATATSAAAGSTCPTGATASPCRVAAAVLTPALTVAATTDEASIVAAGTVHYTLTITDAGQIPYPAGTTVTDNLTGVVDDAAYNTDAAASAGAVAYDIPSSILTWTASATMNPGDSVTVTFSVTVLGNPDPAHMILTTAATSAALGSNCPTGGTDPRCATSVSVSQLTIVTGAYTPGPPNTPISTTTPGSVVRYTTTFTNTGQTPYTGITVATNASDIFDDAAPNGDQTATSGTLVLSGTGLTWTGDIPVGATITITGTATISNPDNGNKVLYAPLTSTAPGNNCPTGGTDPRCSATVNVLIPALTITKTADVSTTTPGSVVNYTITVADTGPTPYTGATITDDLSGTLSDAAYNAGSEAASSGSVTYVPGTPGKGVVTWTGDLAVKGDPGDTVTITYSVTVDDPDNGDKHLLNTVTSSDPGSTCPPDDPSPACTSNVTDLIPGLTITNTAGVATATPGSKVQYTVTVDDTGETSYPGVTITDDLTGALGSAAYNGDARATTGAVSYTDPVLSWTGDLAPGDTATITYSVTVRNPETGTTAMSNTAVSAAAGSNCHTGGSPVQCTATVGIISGPLAMAAPGNADIGAGPPGGTIQGALGSVNVSDDRGFGADWAMSVSSTDFVTGSGSPLETIPVGNAAYAISGLTSAIGSATFDVTPSVDLSADPQAVVSATNVAGNTSVSWDPTISVAVPAGAIGGNYSATIIHSVS